MNWRQPFPFELLPSRLAPSSLLGVDVIIMISPEPFIQKYRSLAQAENPYLEVADGRIRLAWIAGTGDDGHVDYMERVDLIGLGILITYALMLSSKLEAHLMLMAAIP